MKLFPRFMRNRTARRTASSACLTLALLSQIGCGDDGIHRYQVPRLEPPKSVGKSHGQQSNHRLLAAIIPHGERIWFFKLLGPVQMINDQAEAFDRFIRSIRFDAGQEITWTVPEGWEQQPGSAARFASFRIGPADQPLELTVIPLGKEASSIPDNVNRWRGQMGLGPITEAELGKITRELKLDGFSATVVDMSASVPAMAGTGMPSAPGATPAASGRRPLRFTVPQGWTELPAREMRVAAFQVNEGDQRAEMTVIPLRGDAGGLLSNVNRWRGQVGLRDVDQGQLDKELKRIEVAGKTALYVELVGLASPVEEAQSILAAILERGGQTWFFKMTGSAGLVAKQKSPFEEFLRSVQFD